MSKKVASIKVIKPGSNPDVDSDFNKGLRGEVLDYVAETYGKDNFAGIVTFTQLKIKAAIKSIGTIYELPFSVVNKLTALVPDDRCSLADLYDKNSEWYAAGAEFRQEVENGNVGDIIKKAQGLEGRNKTTGVHACGYLISSKPLRDHIPLKIRQEDGRVLTQWEYPECENLGLIKMDFLGLDTIDLIQNTISHIIRAGKTPPNLLEICQGEMDDPEVFKLFQCGDTIGVFQFGSDFIRDLLRRLKPTAFSDLAAATAFGRPGPMGVNAHIRFADRKNGREKVDFVHPEFVGTAMEQILEETYGLICYQEQIMQISNQIAGMTLQEGDDLRKAMGKKKKDIMDSMRPKFFSGALANGFSMDAVTTLWDTIAFFAEYGFNKSHSVAYAMSSYQTAYLKTYFPVEFMAARIEQKLKDKDKKFENIKETKEMGIQIGGADINRSDVVIAPDISEGADNRILFGLGTVSAVSGSTAKTITDERDKNGPFTSVDNFVSRCTGLGINKRVMTNLALAGAFDSLSPNRNAVVESLPLMMNDTKKKDRLGDSLFDFAGMDDVTPVRDDIEDFTYGEKMRLEADMMGQYLTGHPLQKVGSVSGVKTIARIMKEPPTGKNGSHLIIGAIIGVNRKNTKRGTSVSLEIDDGQTFGVARVSKEVVAGFAKHEAILRVRKAYETGATSVKERDAELVRDRSIQAFENVKTNLVYVLEVQTARGYDNDETNIMVVKNLFPLHLTHEGHLPVRLRFKITNENLDRVKKLYRALPATLGKRFPGEIPVHVSSYKVLGRSTKEDDTVEQALTDISTSSGTPRPWPPILTVKPTFNTEPEDIHYAVENLVYKDSGFRVSNAQEVALLAEKYLGFENVDFGIFDP